MTSRQTTKSRSTAAPRLEWLLGAVGMVLLGAGVSFLVYQALTHQDEPGAVSVTVSDIRNTGTAYLVRFAMYNNGGETLSHLHLTAHLSDGDVQVESAQVFIDYLPGRSKHEGGVYLKHDPGRYTLEIVPAGYMKPCWTRKTSANLVFWRRRV